LGGNVSSSGLIPAGRSELKALWVSTDTQTRGGIATYVRDIRDTALWADWNIRHVATHRDGSKWTKLAAFIGGASTFALELIRFRPNLIHLHSSADASFVRKAILLWVSRLAGFPVVLHMHGSDFQDFYDSSPTMLRAAIRASLCRANAVVALGDAWAARLRTIAPEARIVVIPNAVRPARPVRQPEPGQPVRVVFLGRIGDRKGSFRLLHAWAALDAPAAALTIVGDGDVERAQRLIAELGLQDQVEVRDWLSPDSVGELLNLCHILVLPSRQEGQPMAVLEAMARGLCIVASDVGGLAEMIGGGCGVIVSPDDVGSIADGLRLAIEDSELRRRYGAAAFDRIAERYDVRSVVRLIDALYRDILASSAPVVAAAARPLDSSSLH
jgi:glycosyltransferase involved in cell wall biosynthesis